MKIGILSLNPRLYSTNSLVKAAEAAGHEVRVIDYLKCHMNIVSSSPSIFLGDDELKGFDAVIPRIGASRTFFGTAVVRQFEMMRCFTTTTSMALVSSRDKLRSLQILSRAGIGLPKTIFTNYSKNVKKIVDQAGGAPLASFIYS